MHSLVAASRPRLSETEPKLFVFETSCNAFCVRYCIESVVSQNKREYSLKCFTLSYSVNSSCELVLLMYTFIILIMR